MKADGLPPPSHTLLVNRGETALVADLRELDAEVTGGWIHHPRSAGVTPRFLRGRRVSVPPGRHRVILGGMPRAQAAQVGWADFETMIREREAQQTRR
jgi:hypothetical protein